MLFSADQDVKRLDLGGGINFPVFRERRNQVDLVVRGAYSDIDYDSFEFGDLRGGGGAAAAPAHRLSRCASRSRA